MAIMVYYDMDERRWVMARKKKAAKGEKGRKREAKEKPGKEAAASPAEGAVEELMSMDQAIALLKTTRSTFYRWLRSGKIKGMKAGRQWRFQRSDVERFMRGEEPRIELRADIGPLIGQLSERLRKIAGITHYRFIRSKSLYRLCVPMFSRPMAMAET